MCRILLSESSIMVEAFFMQMRVLPEELIYQKPRGTLPSSLVPSAGGGPEHTQNRVAVRGGRDRSYFYQERREKGGARLSMRVGAAKAGCMTLSRVRQAALVCRKA